MSHSSFTVTRKILAFLLVSSVLLFSALPAHAQTNIARNKTVTASSTQGSFTPANVVDGNTKSRWASAAKDVNWITVDLGTSQTFSSVVLRWEAAFASSYQVQTSTDNKTWKTIYSTTSGKGGVETIKASGTGRYVRMYATKRGTGWGYSLWEVEVYGGTTFNKTSDTTNLARGKAATASTSETSARIPANATDGKNETRWSSSKADNNWLRIDLGSTYTFSRVKLNWESAYGKEYQIQVSNDGSAWSTIFTERNGNGGIDDITLNGTGRYVRVLGLKRFSSSWGYSLWEVEVYGSASGTTSSSSSNDSSKASSSSSKAAVSSSSSSSGDKSAPTVPGAVKTKSLESRIEISWSPSIDNVGVTNYEIYRNNVKVSSVSGAVTGYFDNNVVQNMTYSYSVRARDAANNWSAKSTAVNAQLLATATTPAQITLSWSNPTARENGDYLELDEIGGYEIRYRKSTDSSYTKVMIKNNQTNKYSMSAPSGTYVYEIATYDSTGLYSEFVSIRPR